MLTEKFLVLAQMGDQAILWMLVGLSVLSIALILERGFVLYSIGRQSQNVRQKIKTAIDQKNFQVLDEISRDTSSIEGRALVNGLHHLKENGIEGLEELFNAMTIIEKKELERYLGFMATLGSNAPYIGLLGTVMGIMKAFHDLSINSEPGQQTVMAGISAALVATAAGLVVAIPAVLAFNLYSKKVKGILLNLDLVKELCLVSAKKRG